MILWFFFLPKKYGRLKQANLPINPMNSCLRGGWAWILFTFLVIYQGRETVRWPPIALIHWRLKYSTVRRSSTHRHDADCYLCPPLLSSGKDLTDWTVNVGALTRTLKHTHTHTHTHTQCRSRHLPAGHGALGYSGPPPLLNGPAQLPLSSLPFVLGHTCLTCLILSSMEP